MTRHPTLKRRAPSRATAPPVAPTTPATQVPAIIPPRPRPEATPAEAHRHAALDRGVMASLSRLTGGASPHAIIDAWGDWPCTWRGRQGGNRNGWNVPSQTG